jgi:hypothetical protein
MRNILTPAVGLPANVLDVLNVDVAPSEQSSVAGSNTCGNPSAWPGGTQDTGS